MPQPQSNMFGYWLTELSIKQGLKQRDIFVILNWHDRAIFRCGLPARMKLLVGRAGRTSGKFALQNPAMSRTLYGHVG